MALMNDRFVAIDFETANPDLASICQVGVVIFERDIVVDRWETLVNPETYFDEINVSIHGITERQVKNAPTFPQILENVASRLCKQVVVSHAAFDRLALSQSLGRYRLTRTAVGWVDSIIWLDSARVVRRAWARFAEKGYGLSNVCRSFGIEYEEHHAVEDARAAGELLLRAMRDTGLDLSGWLARVKKPIDLSSTLPIVYDGNPDGHLYGEKIVFTGALNIRRHDAAALAAKAGCNVATGVTKRTTILVVGDQDIMKLAGYEKSAKHRKAEELIAKGHPIRILRETDFVQLVDIP
jgi:DNA polymerase III subunit epsilon